MEDKFKIKSYGYGELALLYFQNSSKKSASVQFRRWIKLNSTLAKGLYKIGHKPEQRILTPKQVEFIIEVLGAP